MKWGRARKGEGVQEEEKARERARAAEEQGRGGRGRRTKPLHRALLQDSSLERASLAAPSRSPAPVDTRGRTSPLIRMCLTLDP